MVVVSVVVGLLWFYVVVLLFRMVMSWVFALSRGYRPTGLMAAALEVTYTLTDPPLKLLGRVIPPLRIGAMALDVAFLVLFLAVIVLIQVLQTTA